MKYPSRSTLLILVPILVFALWLQFRSSEPEKTAASEVRKSEAEGASAESNDLNVSAKPDPGLQNEKPHPGTQPKPEEPAADVEEDADQWFSPPMRELVEGVEEGRPVRVQMGGQERQYLFRPVRITADEFRISAGPEEEMPSSFRVYEGRRMLANGRLTESAKLAVVNDTASMALTTEEGNVLIERNEAGEMVARLLRSADPDLGIGQTECLEADGIAGMQSTSDRSPLELAAGIHLAGEAGAGAEAAWPDHNFYRNGPQYDASLKDILILMVSGSTQTGSSSNLSSRAASYLTYAAKTADTYENQLGLRYLLQELVLIAEGSGEPDIEVAGTNSTLSGSDDLSALGTWANTHRSKLTYGWGHIAGWTEVDGSGGGTIGYANIDGYGRLGSARSVQERNYDWDVHAHELGHNVGASHTSGGVMNPKIQSNNQDFFRENGSIGGYTGAMDIYNYMADDNRTDIYGEERLRHAEELPFAVDDFVSTDLNTPVTFNPISNDLDSVMLGRTNTHLRLVEAGAVYPANAGTVSQDGNELTFTPATGFSGNVWFRYTLGGNIGNNNKGWLHAADVVVTVGGNNSDPGLSPSMTLVDDVLVSDLSGPVRVNPLLNDIAEGRLWSGDVEALNDVDGTPQAYSDDAFHLVSATVVTGNGSVSLDTRNMTRSASPGTDYTGYLTYTPSGSEPGTIEISYTAEDANGSQASASVFIHNRTAVTLSASSSLFSEVEGRVVELTFSRSGAADLSASETVSFSVGGAVSAAGANADIALGGHASFDVDSRSGTIVIPAGQSEAVLKLSAYDDGVVEGQEKMLIQMTGAESLSIPDEPSLLLTLWDDAVGGKPLVESFDQFAEPNGIGQENAWNNPSSGDDPNQDWEVQSGGTPSNETGPSADHTSGSGNYVYYETSSGFNGSTAYLESPVFSLAGESTADLEFYYHMYGASIGSLAVDIKVDGGSWNLDALSWTGQQSVDATDWKQATLDLSGYLPTGTMQLRFRATRGNNFTGDIALDDVKVTFPFSLSTESPVIEAQPQSQVVGEGDPVYFSVVARSYPSASYQWFKDGSPISGATRSVLSFSSTSASDAGTYTCEVTSGSTVTTQNAVLSIDTIPTVVIDSPSPSPVEIASGSTLTLEATATDDGALTTTWTMVNGPTAAVFDDASAEDTTVTFPQTGAYRLRLTADDGNRQGEAEILVMVGSGAVEDRFPSGGEVGTYPLDASSGTAATDSSGNDYHGTLVGGPVWQSSGGKIGGALQFDGGDDLVELVSLAGFNTAYSNSSRSVALWFHADDISVSTRKQILWEAGGGSHGYSIYLFNSQLYVATWSDSGATNNAYLTSAGISNSTWHHVALTLSASSLTGYLDGAEIDTASVAALPEHSNDNGIGNAFGATRFHDGNGSSGQDHGFDGRIDHVGLYTRVLTSTEIAELAGAVQNRAPVVDAGADDDPSSPSTGVAFALSGSAVDPDTDPMTFIWTKESGAGITFTDPSDATTTATFASSGTYILRLSASDGSVTVSDTVQFTVTDSSSPGLLQLTSASYNPGEGDGNLSVQVERVNGISGGVGVTLSTVNGTALAGEDFTAVSQAVTWADGELGSKSVLIPLLEDSAVESLEQFQVELSLATGGASLGNPDTGTVTITDNDLPGTLQLTASTANVDEDAGTVTLTVSRTGGDAGAVSVDYATSDDTATVGSDYTAASGTLTWTDGDSADKDIVISITDDSDGEGTESFTVDLSNPSVATLGSPSSATVSITDNEETSYLINFGLTNYTSDGSNTWQTFNTTDATAVNTTASPVAISETVLADSGGSTLAGVTFQTDISGSGSSTAAINGNVTEVMLQGDPYAWYDGSVAAQRQVPAMQNGNSQVFTLGGFALTDLVDVEFVFKRDSTGDRAVTVTYQTTGDVMNDLQVDDEGVAGVDGGPQYPSITGLQGSDSYSFTIDSTGTGWGCLPNAIRVRVRPGGDFSPEVIPGLVGWYDAQALSGSDGTAVTTWTDTTGGTNSVADNLTQVTGDLYLTGTQNAVAPTLQTVSLNGYSFRSVKFVPGTNGNDEYELLKAADLVSSTDTSRTIIAVYKGGLVTESRVIGFGSSQEEDINAQARVWNLGCDDNGTSRFDGAMIGSYSAGLDRSQVVVRTAVMESKTSFDEYIDVLDGTFVDQQVLFNGTPSNALADIRGHFYVGDLQEQSNSDGTMAAEFDVLEVLVFDAALSDAQRQNVQDWLKTKYTTNPNPSAIIEVVRNSDSAVMSTHASVSDAIANLPGGTGYTIVMPAGTFTESGALLLPEGIGLRGAGVDSTTLVSTYASAVSGAFPPDKFAIQLDSASQTAGDQILEDFTLDGSSWTVQGGIYVDNRTGLTLRDLRVRNFSWSGAWVERVQNVNLTNVEVLESSWSDNNYASGSIGIGDADTVTLDQVTITSTNSGGGSRGVGYGIKATHSNSGGRFWETVVIQNSTIDVLPNGVWNGGQAPNISIEAHNLEIRNSRITNNTLYNNMSIVGTASGATPSMRIDNNQVVLKDASASNGNYGVEMSTPNMEIDHNYFGGNMVRAFADWTANRPLTGMSIHHNIFQGNTGDTLVWLKSEAPGLLFANNVVGETSSTGGHRVFYFDAGDSAGLQIANNLFQIPSGSSDESLIVLNSGASASSLTVRNNWFQRITTGTPAGTWTDNQTGSAPIQGAGDFWDTYYQPQAFSALVDAGADVGLSFQGAAPEIGRWEVDVPTAPSGLGATAASSTQINLTWTDHSGDETGFKVQQSTSSGSGFSTIATTAADATSYSDTGLAAGMIYYYQVIATNASGDSAPTSEASATTWTTEQQYFSDNGLAYNVDPTEDSDNDGMSNEDEFTAGTDPNNGGDIFHATTTSSGGGMSLQAPTVNGKYYRVVRRDSLTSGDWTVVDPHDGTSASNGSGLDVSVSTDGFYRVEVSDQTWGAAP